MIDETIHDQLILFLRTVRLRHFQYLSACKVDSIVLAKKVWSPLEIT
jgi:hypothetical protein